MSQRRRLSDRDRVLRAVPERDFLAQIIEAAEWLGWLVFHDRDSRMNRAGFPDLILVGTGPRMGRLLFLELKTETGVLSQAQLIWLGALEQVGTVQVMTARPRDMDAVMVLLGGG